MASHLIQKESTKSRTTLKLWATIDADMDEDSATVLGLSLCRLMMENMMSQDIPVATITSFAEHE